jgi:hypothetical protein
MASRSTPRPAVTVPVRYPTAAVFVDESGSRASANDFFVVAALKVREPGKLARAVREVRDRHGFTGEFKFARITKGSVSIYADLINVLEESDATLAATLVTGAVFDPFEGREDTWRVHAEVTAQLLVGGINRRELVGVHLDAVSTPVGCSFEDTVRSITNSRLRNTSVVSAVCLDSRTNDLLQVADMVAGAIRNVRQQPTSPYKDQSPKTKVAQRLAATFGRPGLVDGKDDRVNIATYRGRKPAAPRLRAVSGRRATGRPQAG